MKERIEALLKEEGINLEDFYSVSFTEEDVRLQGEWSAEKAEKYNVTFEWSDEHHEYHSAWDGNNKVVLTIPINHEQE